MQMRQRDVAALDAKYTKELADAKAKMMLCVMMPLVVVGCIIKQSVSRVRSHHASGVDNAASPRLADTAERDYFTSERGWSLCKNNWKEPRSIVSSADRAAHGKAHAIIVSNTHALPAYKCLK